MIRKDIMKYIAAFTLGDGSLRKKGTNAMYRIAQVEDHKDYLDWQASILEELTTVNFRYELKNPGKNQWSLETKQHPAYTTVFNRMYPNGHKVIDPHYLTLIDFETLAILYMDDGCLAKRYNTQYDRLDYNIILCTDSFTYGDNYIFAKAIKEKTGFMFDVVRQHNNEKLHWRLRLNKKQTPNFIEKVTPFIQPSFTYKLNLSND